MPIRPAGAAALASPVAVDTVSASDFDPNEDNGPEIPSDLEPTLRDRAQTVLEQNPYITDAQMEAVVRLVKLYARFDEMQAEINRVGVTVYDAKKEIDIPNPLLAVQLNVQSRIIAQERQLAISIPARHEQIDKRDRKPRKKPPEQAPGARKLRIA